MKEKASASARRSKNERIEEELRTLYNFRFNTVKSRTEYRDIHAQGEFRPVTKYFLNSLRREIDVRIGITTSADNIRAILESNFAEKVHPIREYLSRLPLLNPLDFGYTEQLLQTVEVSNPDKWNEYLVKWLIGVVANAMSDVGCQNHTCLVLTGEQGKFKTTWLDHLCPDPLKSYLFTGKIDPQGKDVLTLIAEYLFINIDDQLRALNKRDENELKNLITTPAVKYRRPYDTYIEEYSHLASFMASVNGNDFLTDPTGSRRFLPFEVIRIDIDKALSINMDHVFSEIMYLYKQGVRYWFDDKEIEELHRLSSGFHVQTVEYEMLMQGFEKPNDTDDSFMTTAQVLNYLRMFSSLPLSEKRMGEAIRKAGFTRTQKRINRNPSPVYGYRIKKIKPNPFVDQEL
ncbi:MULTISPECIES: VapE domain-containing protein [Dysgonomonas]|uniref:VapE domain-containing protein n=1 Tax=Dysgonomonas TaxID=156973 RepID=UPI00092AA94C|nr:MULTISPECIES: VapE domain-containing protein [Dysgonomonas]MBN9302273.1 virulence protein [Dysgonomonas mossii]OJX63598.1 MAG: virulence protein [Dysgonomonas sp. 37-18]